LDGDIAIDNGTLNITASRSANGGYGEIYIVESGNSADNNIYVSLSNSRGLDLTCTENSNGMTGGFCVGLTNDGNFRILTSQGNEGGTGFTGTKNGFKFVNGICVNTD